MRITFKVLAQGKHKLKIKCFCGKSYKIKKSKLETFECSCKDNASLHSKKSLYNRYKNSAEKRGYSFNVTPIQFCKVTEGNCFYCGSAPNQKSGKIVYNGVDRVDNNLGYEFNNIAACCGKCNKSKGILDPEEFLELCKKVVAQTEKRDIAYKSIASDKDYHIWDKFAIKHGAIGCTKKETELKIVRKVREELKEDSFKSEESRKNCLRILGEFENEINKL